LAISNLNRLSQKAQFTRRACVGRACRVMCLLGTDLAGYGGRGADCALRDARCMKSQTVLVAVILNRGHGTARLGDWILIRPCRQNGSRLQKPRALIEQVMYIVHSLRNTGSEPSSAFSSQIDLIHHRRKAGGVCGKTETGRLGPGWGEILRCVLQTLPRRTSSQHFLGYS
jgi:hypothetical protein